MDRICKCDCIAIIQELTNVSHFCADLLTPVNQFYVMHTRKQRAVRMTAEETESSPRQHRPQSLLASLSDHAEHWGEYSKMNLNLNFKLSSVR